MSNYLASYSYEDYNDTTLEYTEDNGLELTFTGYENYSDVLVYNGENSCVEELMLELYTEIKCYLDSKEHRAFGGYAGAAPDSYYDEYDRTSLHAFEELLMQELRLD